MKKNAQQENEEEDEKKGERLNMLLLLFLNKDHFRILKSCPFILHCRIKNYFKYYNLKLNMNNC